MFLQALLIDILLAGVEIFEPTLEDAEARVHKLESELLAAEPHHVDWCSLFRTKLRIQTIKRLLWHVQNASDKYVPRSSANQPLAQDLRERITSLHFLAESLDDDLDNLLSVQLSLAANRTNEVVRCSRYSPRLRALARP